MSKVVDPSRNEGKCRMKLKRWRWRGKFYVWECDRDDHAHYPEDMVIAPVEEFIKEITGG